MIKEFLVVGEETYHYSKLIEDINLKEKYSEYIYVKQNSPYEIFLKLLHSMLYDYPVEILDGDFSETELKNIGIDIEKVKEQKDTNQKIEIESLMDILGESKSNINWTISLYTSGTTGIPKKVTHTIETITRNVKIGEQFHNNVWGYAYNPTHMAGLQVFFQAIFNENTIVYIFGNEIVKAKENIKKYRITNISATSTYYRNLLMHIKEDIYGSVKYVTFGGEKCDIKIKEEISKVFPNAKTRNIYASTEAGSLFNAHGEIFTIPDKIKNLVKIVEENELWIHKSLLGNSDTFNLDDDWYNTQDIIEKIDENRFIFLSRKSDLINIGGYKVNPLEVEEILSNIQEIEDIKVYARKNSVTGNIIVADVVIVHKEKERETKQSIRQYAIKNLQSWKIPRIINVVEKLEQTRTGKKARA